MDMKIRVATIRMAAAGPRPGQDGISATAEADIITYTETTTVSGTLTPTGGTQQTFTNAMATFTQTANTAAITVNGTLDQVISTTSTFTIAGVGTGSVSSSSLITSSRR